MDSNQQSIGDPCPPVEVNNRGLVRAAWQRGPRVSRDHRRTAHRRVPGFGATWLLHVEPWCVVGRL